MTRPATRIVDDLKRRGDPRQAERAGRFFKTGKGQYCEGAVFAGVLMPELRQLAKAHTGLTLADTEALLQNELCEARLLALLILVNKFRDGTNREQDAIARHYLRNSHRVNNWALVDCPAHLILGPWLEKRSRKKLDTLARSSNLWERRMAMIATFHFIRQGEFDDALRIAAILVNDREELIQKATGWMLREIGNRDRAVEAAFLTGYYRAMPRTMLRYAIEKFPQPLRVKYLKGSI